MSHLPIRRLVPVLAFLGVIGTASGAEGEGSPRILKVFLADFEDVPHPETYTKQYFSDLFFGLGSPRETPEGRPIAGSVREYFLDLSEGRIDIAGDVVDWVRIPRRIGQIPHWKPGMEPFGESWPVIVAETLRANDITGPECRQKLALADGSMPELLVFLNTDWGVGGVNRGWGRLKEVLGMMHLADLWDENWLALPSPYSSYSATIWRHAPGTALDGTIDRVPPAAELELFPLSIMMHEMGHQLAGLPDLYGPAYEPWGVFDLMGGPAASTHFPMSIAAFQRERSGWMHFTDVARGGSAILQLHPLESHKEAFRFRQGPGQESLIVENRSCLRYPREYSQPPVDDGPRLLIYRYDPAGRAQRMSGDSPVGRITSMVRRGASYGEVWGESPFNELSASTRPWSRNALGELWWEFAEISPQPDRNIGFRADFRARDLVTDYHVAVWRDHSGRAVVPGTYGSLGGHVAIRQLLSPSSGNLERVLHCRPAPGGVLIGRYDLTSRTPSRLYMVMEGAPGTAADARLSVSVDAEEVLTDWVPQPGQRAGIVLDLPAASTALALTVSSPAGADACAGIMFREAWLVGLPPTLFDLLSTRPEAGVGVSGVSAMRMTGEAFDGFVYGPRCLAVGTAAEAGVGEKTLCYALPTLPEGAAVRAVIALAAATADGARAVVSLSYDADGEVVPGLQGMLLRKQPLVLDHWPQTLSNAAIIVEASVPPKVCQAAQAHVLLTVNPSGDMPAVVLFPCLRISGD